MIMQVYSWMSQWSLGPVNLLAKPLTWKCLILFTSNAFVFFLMQGRELHGHPNNINCVIQCMTNPLDQSIHSIIEQNKSCQVAEVRLQNDLRNCVQNNTDLNKNYMIQSGLLDDTKEKQEITSKELEQLSKEIKKERKDFQWQNLSCVTTQQQLKKDLASCKENYTYTLESKTKQLENVTKELKSKTKQLSVFTNHLQLLKSVYNQVEQMETCRIRLKEYCELKNKGESLTKFEKGTMERFESDIGCKRRISKNFYDRIIFSYTIKFDILLEAQEMLVNLLITGSLEKMAKVQKQEKYLPFNKCQFICELEEQEPTETNYYEKVRDATWSILQRIFK